MTVEYMLPLTEDELGTLLAMLTAEGFISDLKRAIYNLRSIRLKLQALKQGVPL